MENNNNNIIDIGSETLNENGGIRGKLGTSEICLYSPSSLNSAQNHREDSGDGTTSAFRKHAFERKAVGSVDDLLSILKSKEFLSKEKEKSSDGGGSGLSSLEISSSLSDSSVWIDIKGINSSEEIMKLLNFFEIHLVTYEDILSKYCNSNLQDKDERSWVGEKCQLFPHYLHLSMRIFQFQDSGDQGEHQVKGIHSSSARSFLLPVRGLHHVRHEVNMDKDKFGGDVGQKEFDMDVLFIRRRRSTRGSSVQRGEEKKKEDKEGMKESINKKDLTVEELSSEEEYLVTIHHEGDEETPSATLKSRILEILQDFVSPSSSVVDSQMNTTAAFASASFCKWVLYSVMSASLQPYARRSHYLFEMVGEADREVFNVDYGDLLNLLKRIERYRTQIALFRRDLVSKHQHVQAIISFLSRNIHLDNLPHNIYSKDKKNNTPSTFDNSGDSTTTTIFDNLRKSQVDVSAISNSKNKSKNNFGMTEMIIYFRNIQSYLKGLTNQVEFSRDLILQSHTNYLSRVSIEVQEIAHNNDKFMTFTCILGEIQLPYSLFCGLFGFNVMNWWFVGPDYLDTTPFWVVMGLSTLTAVLMVVISIVAIDVRQHLRR